VAVVAIIVVAAIGYITTSSSTLAADWAEARIRAREAGTLSTEDLRLARRRYRSFFDRLLSM
jgi:hypothetical protein